MVLLFVTIALFLRCGVTGLPAIQLWFQLRSAHPAFHPAVIIPTHTTLCFSAPLNHKRSTGIGPRTRSFLETEAGLRFRRCSVQSSGCRLNRGRTHSWWRLCRGCQELWKLTGGESSFQREETLSPSSSEIMWPSYLYRPPRQTPSTGRKEPADRLVCPSCAGFPHCPSRTWGWPLPRSHPSIFPTTPLYHHYSSPEMSERKVQNSFQSTDFKPFSCVTWVSHTMALSTRDT